MGYFSSPGYSPGGYSGWKPPSYNAPPPSLNTPPPQPANPPPFIQRPDLNQLVTQASGEGVNLVAAAAHAPGYVMERPLAWLNTATSTPQQPKGVVDQALDTLRGVPVLGPVLSAAGDFISTPWVAKFGNAPMAQALAATYGMPDEAVVPDAVQRMFGPPMLGIPGLAAIGEIGSLLHGPTTVGELRKNAFARNFTPEDITAVASGKKGIFDFGDHSLDPNPLVNIGLQIGLDPTNLLLGAGLVGKLPSGLGLATKFFSAFGKEVPKAFEVGLTAFKAGRQGFKTAPELMTYQDLGRIANSIGRGTSAASKAYVRTSLGMTAAELGMTAAGDALHNTPLGPMAEGLADFARRAQQNQPLSNNNIFSLLSAFKFPYHDTLADSRARLKLMNDGAFGSDIMTRVTNLLEPGKEHWKVRQARMFEKFGGEQSFNAFLQRTLASIAYDYAHRFYKGVAFDSAAELDAHLAQAGLSVENILRTMLEKNTISGRDVAAKIVENTKNSKNITDFTGGVEFPFSPELVYKDWHQWQPYAAELAQISEKRSKVVVGLMQDKPLSNSWLDYQQAELQAVAVMNGGVVPRAYMEQFIHQTPQLLRDEPFQSNLARYLTPDGPNADIKELNKLFTEARKTAPDLKDYFREMADWERRHAETAPFKRGYGLDQTALPRAGTVTIEAPTFLAARARSSGLKSITTTDALTLREKPLAKSFRNAIGPALDEAGYNVNNVVDQIGYSAARREVLPESVVSFVGDNALTEAEQVAVALMEAGSKRIQGQADMVEIVASAHDAAVVGRAPNAIEFRWDFGQLTQAQGEALGQLVFHVGQRGIRSSFDNTRGILKVRVRAEQLAEPTLQEITDAIAKAIPEDPAKGALKPSREKVYQKIIVNDGRKSNAQLTADEVLSSARATAQRDQRYFAVSRYLTASRRDAEVVARTVRPSGVQPAWAANRPGPTGRGIDTAASGITVAEPPPGYKRLFHGTTRDFGEFDPKVADPTALYGPGTYLTDNQEVAFQYAGLPGRGAADAAERAAVLSVDVPDNLKLLDLEKPLPQDAIDAIAQINDPVPMRAEALRAFVRQARENVSLSQAANTADLPHPGYLAWTEAKTTLEDAASHAGRDPAPHKAEMLTAINEALAKAGYDGLTHIGGKIMGNVEHNVTIVFDTSKAKIAQARGMGALRVARTWDKLEQLVNNIESLPKDAKGLSQRQYAQPWVVKAVDDFLAALHDTLDPAAIPDALAELRTVVERRYGSRPGEIKFSTLQNERPQMVPVSEAQKFLYTPDAKIIAEDLTRPFYQKLRAEMEQNGLDPQLPIKIIVDRNTGFAYVGDGNHRLAIAKELGIDNINVKFFEGKVGVGQGTPISELHLPAFDNPMPPALDEALLRAHNDLVASDGNMGQVLFNAELDKLTDAIPFDRSLSDMSDAEKAQLIGLQRKIVAESPFYTLKKINAEDNPYPYVRNQGELVEKYLRNQKDWVRSFFSMGPVSAAGRVMEMMFAPRPWGVRADEAKQSIYNRLLNAGATVKEINSYWAALRAESQSARFMGVNLSRGYDAMIPSVYRDIAIGKKKVGPEKGIVFDGFPQKVIDNIGENNFWRIFEEASSEYYRNVHNAALRDGKAGQVGRLLEKLYGRTQTISHYSKIYYHTFRFLLDPRWWLMNKMETNIMLGLKEGVNVHGADLYHPSNAAMAHANMKGSEALEAVGPFAAGWLDNRRLLGPMAKAFDVEAPRSVERYLNSLPETDPITRLMVERFGKNKETWAKQLNEQLYSFDMKGPKQTVIDDAKKLFTTDEFDIMERSGLLQRIWDNNTQVWSDVQHTLRGNPNRSMAERLLNSYWLYWPISYQLKAGKWLYDLLTHRMFGKQTNFGGVWMLNHVQDTHYRLMATDPSYVDMMENHPETWFFATMIMPITPFDLGVSLSRPAKIVGAVPGIWDMPSYGHSPFDTVAAMAQMGPLFTAELLKKIGKEVGGWDALLAPFSSEAKPQSTPGTYKWGP